MLDTKCYAILDRYPEIFIHYVCQFYPMPWEWIEKYKYEFSTSPYDPLGSRNHWTYLSKNINLEWNLEKILQYEYFWNWTNLVRNENDRFRWDLESIEAVKPRIDVKEMLGNDHFGKLIYPTEALIQKYHKKKLSIYETHPDCDPSWAEKYNVIIEPPFEFREVTSAYKETPLDPNLIQDLDGYLNYHYDSHLEEKFYEIHCKPILEKHSLQEIFDSLFYSNNSDTISHGKWFFWSPMRNDRYGLIPLFEEKEEHSESPFPGIKEEWDPYRPVKKLPPDPSREFILIPNDTYKEGKERIQNIMEVELSGPRNSGKDAFTILLVSEKVSEVLKSFRLPEHRFYPAKLQHKKLQSKEKYFIFLLTKDSLLHSIDWSLPYNFIYRAQKTIYPEFGSRDVNGYAPRTEYYLWKYNIDNPPRSPEELYDLQASENKKNGISSRSGSSLLPSTILRTNDFDLYTLRGNAIVSEKLQMALEEKFPNESWFRSAGRLGI
ncbi:MAG: hypothetical protein JJT78_13810 [Leptospira sp.]|nr:hypothetical protein [Leptospira sp.]